MTNLVAAVGAALVWVLVQGLRGAGAGVLPQAAEEGMFTVFSVQQRSAAED